MTFYQSFASDIIIVVILLFACESNDQRFVGHLIRTKNERSETILRRQRFDAVSHE